MDLRRWAFLILLALPIGCGAAQPPPPAGVPGGGEAESAAPMAAARPEPAREPEATELNSSTEKGDAPKPPEAAVVSEKLGGGQLSQNEIRDIVTKNAELFDACYTIGAGKSQQFVATVTVKATIGPTGTVNETEIKSSTAKNKKVDTCVADAFKKIKFPAPKGAVTSVITFPMEFNGAEEVR